MFIRLLLLLILLAHCGSSAGQYYGSSSQAVQSSRHASVTLTRNPGPSWPGPHGSCLMCLGNHLLGSHGYTYDYLSRVGYQQWSVLHDNAHNQVASAKPKTKPRPQPIYAPTPDSVINELLALVDVPSHGVFVDLGSGDGRVVLAAAKRFGCRCVGVERDPAMIRQSRQLAYSAGTDVSGRITFHQADVTNVDLSNVDVVFCYLETSTLEKLLPRFATMRPEAVLVSYQHQVPRLVLQRYEIKSELFAYTNVPRSVFSKGR